jgi:hypothetical protein
MPSFVERRSRGRVVLLTVMAIALSACVGSSTTAGPRNSGATSSPNAGLGAAASAFANVRSYTFGMTLAGGTFSSMLSMLPTSSAVGDAPFTIGGTIIVKPEEAADIKMIGLHIIEIGGQDYLDMSGTGSFDQITISGTKLAERFSPATMFSSAINPSTVGGYDRIGSDTKNGVQADHYRASSAGLATLGSIAAITGATWTADVWTAQDGGYPVSMAIVGTAVDDSIVYEILFDISNVNDPANKVTVPTKVTGA